jgi:hypothetical protein
VIYASAFAKKRYCARAHFELNPVVGKYEFPHILKFKIPGHSGDRNSLLRRTVSQNMYTIQTNRCHSNFEKKKCSIVKIDILQ